MCDIAEVAMELFQCIWDLKFYVLNFHISFMFSSFKNIACEAREHKAIIFAIGCWVYQPPSSYSQCKGQADLQRSLPSTQHL